MTRRELPEVKVHKDWHKSDKGCWSLTLGWRECRVRAMQREPGGTFYGITWIPGRGQDWKSFRTTNRREAQERAEALIRALFANEAPAQAQPPTLGELWNRYQQEAAGYRQNTKRTQTQKRDSVKRLMLFFGTQKRVDHLTANDADRYALTRRTGHGWPHAQVTAPVRDNAVRHDLAVLRTMILWAMKEKRPDGSWLLPDNPLRGMRIPREKNPRRPVASYDRFTKVREAVQRLSLTAPQERGRTRWIRLELALVLAEATGRRIGAIRGLRWSDISSDPATIRWRAEFDKGRREWVVPIPEELADELRRFKVRLEAVGDGWVFPCTNVDAPWPREIFRELLVRAERAAGVPHLQGASWHAFRRKWATEKGELPVKALMEAGGWKDLQTLVTCYQHPSEEMILKVMSHPVKLRDRKASAAG